MSRALPTGRSRSLGLLALSAALFAAVLGAAYAAFSHLDVPDYGAWTGIRPLENKLAMLEGFSARGDVDALVLGSSIVDFGFSAELYSRLASEHLGREYRMFNFSSGGAEPRTLPKLYRLARTVVKPRTVFVIVPAEQKLDEALSKGSPDTSLLNAPVGAVLNHPLILKVTKLLWDTPVFRGAPAMRDRVLFGEYKNLQRAVGMEAYYVDGYGDRVSYTVTWRPADLPIFWKSNEVHVQPYPGAVGAGPAQMRRMLEFYFARTDIAAMRELRELVEKDGGRIVLVSHAAAATLWGGPTANAEYVRSREKFFQAFAWQLNAPYWNAVDNTVRVPLYGIADTTHLNTHGAEMYTRLAFAAGLGKLAAASDQVREAIAAAPRLDALSTAGPTIHVQSALVRRPANQAHALLKFRMVDTLAVPPLPKAVDMYVGLRMPDESDVVVPAHAIGPGDFVAEVNLPPSAGPEAILLRLMYDAGGEKVALGNPLADYEWLTGYPRTPLRAPPPAGALRVLALPPEQVAGRALYVALAQDQPAQGELTVRLAPAGKAEGRGSVDLGKWRGADRLLKLALPANIAGSYEVQVLDADGRTPLGRSRPVQVLDSRNPRQLPRVWAQPAPLPAAGPVKVFWTGIRRSHAQDWVGLFPTGGNDASRMEMNMTNGAVAGAMAFAISPSVAPKLATGRYEFRLYAEGGWRLLARSDPVTFTAAQK